MKQLLSIFISLILWGYCTAQQGELKLHQLSRYGIEDGLPTEIINCGIQDSSGFIWLGTRKGLVRFDGKEFIPFPTPEGSDFTSNILRIRQVERDELWVLFGRSLFDNNEGGEVWKFNLDTHSFSALTEEFPIFSGKSVMEIEYVGTHGLALSCDKGGLYTYHPSQGINSIDFGSPEHRNFIGNIDGSIWTAHKRFPHDTLVKIFQLNTRWDTLRAMNYRVSPDQDFLITAVSQTGDPIAIIRNAHSAFQNIVAIIEEGIIEEILPHHTGLNSEVTLTSKLQSFGTDEGWQLWYRENENGIFFLDSDNELHHVLDFEAAASVPHMDFSVSFFKGQGNNYWLCSSLGLYHFVLREKRFTNIESHENPANRIQARGILKDNKGRLFIAAGDAGVLMVDTNGRTSTLSRGEAYQLCFKDSGRVLFGSSRVEAFRKSSGIDHAYSRLDLSNLWTTYLDKEGKRWFGGSGVKRCDNLNGICKDLTSLIFESSQDPGVVYQVFEEIDHFWVVSSKGVFQLDQSLRSVCRLEDLSENLNSGDVHDVHHILRHGGRWYISTNGIGLVVWDPISDEVWKVDKDDGLPSDVIYAAVAENEGGSIWLSTNFGLVQMDEDLQSFTRYNVDDGLSHHEFNRISWYKDKEGLIYFGGMNGVNCLNPKNFDSPKEAFRAPVQVSKYYEFNEDEQKLENAITKLKIWGKIELSANSNFCDLSFSYLDFRPEAKSFCYMLQGLDEEWQKMEGDELQLGNLPYGSYEILVKAQNQAGIWSSNTLRIPLEVIAPYYYRRWFIGLAIFLSTTLVILIIRWRTWYLHRDRERLQLLVDSQTHQLQESLEEKSLLLKEVHHRVKNNLQIISSLLNLDRAAKKDEASNQLLSQARQRIKSMALIHKNLYQFDNLSRIEVESYLEELIQNLDRAYNRDPDNIKYKIEARDVELDVDIAIPLGLIVTELVSNSYKYAFTPGDKGILSVQVSTHQDILELVVLDNGIGLPENFDINEVSSLGLRLVNMLCDQLNGSFIYTALASSKFHFKFPLSQAVSVNE